MSATKDRAKAVRAPETTINLLMAWEKSLAEQISTEKNVMRRASLSEQLRIVREEQSRRLSGDNPCPATK